jgi:hypothetical protein
MRRDGGSVFPAHANTGDPNGPNRGLSANENARALISMMARSKCSNQRPDTLMQDRSPPARRNHLQRTAGPYIRVRSKTEVVALAAGCLLYPGYCAKVENQTPLKISQKPMFLRHGRCNARKGRCEDPPPFCRSRSHIVCEAEAVPEARMCAHYD